MALLQRTRLLADERLDKPDYSLVEDMVCSDFKAINKYVWTDENFVVSGFECTGTGTTDLTIALAGSSFIVGQDDGVMFIAAPSLADIVTDALTPGVTNYVELYVDQDTGGADSRAFWDQTAGGGVGGEFAQIIDTFIFLTPVLSISTSTFSGDPDKVRICEVDVNGGGTITAIRDARSLLYRLGRPGNATFSFPWASRTEPATTQFTGADKDITRIKDMFDALMTEIKLVKGTTYWFETAAISLVGGFRNAALSELTANTTTAKFSWSGTELSITDDNGAPTQADVLAFIRLFDSSSNLQLTRQDGGSTIAIADGEVLWVQLPSPLAHTVYDGVGVAATNYRITARGSVPNTENTFWLAYRESGNLYVRGLGELEPGESAEISDTINENILAAIGLATEVSMPSYTAVSSGSLNLPNYNTTVAESLVSRVAKLTAMLADVQQNWNIQIDPGAVTWDGSSISITGAQLSIPGTSIGAAPVSINTFSGALADNSCLYVDIDRVTGTALTLSSSTLALLTPSQQRLVVARRLGSSIYMRAS